MKKDSNGRKMRKAGDFDWTDPDFLGDTTFYTGLEFCHFWAGVGRLTEVMQNLRFSLTACQGLVADNTPDCPPVYDLRRRNVRIKEDEIRDSALGRVFSIRYPGWRSAADDEIRKVIGLTEDLEYFVYRFFSEQIYDEEMTNEALLRLKRAIDMADRMDERYVLFELDKLYLDYKEGS